MKQLIDALAGHRVIVVGDVFLDEYLIGQAERLSREAPVPVLAFRSRRQVPGGGANPAMNLAALGARVSQVGVVGDDAEGAALRALLAAAGVDASGLVTDPARPTISKLRVVAEGELRYPQQLARVDRQSREPLAAPVETQVVAELRRLAAEPALAAILFSDYRSGLITAGAVEAARAIARRGPAAAGRPLLAADTQGDLDKYRGFTLVKTNRSEAEAYLGRRLQSERDFEAALAELTDRLDVAIVLITRGSDGLSVGVRGEGQTHLPATNVSEVFDVTGAGDTVIAVAALALAAGADPVKAAMLANYAGGVVVRRLGNAVVTREELEAEIGAAP